jgi:hypothetical protein
MAVRHDLFYHEVVVDSPAADFLVKGNQPTFREDRLDEPKRHRQSSVRSE